MKAVFLATTALLLLFNSDGIQGAKFLILGGNSEDGFHLETEIIDLDDPEDTCVNPAPIPAPGRSGSEAQLMEDDTVLLCGGRTSMDPDFLDECIHYDFTLGVWLPDAFMNEPRFSAESLFVEDVLMIFGGRSGDEEFLSSVEYYDPNTLSWVISDEVELPGGSAFFQHCMLKINDSLAIQAGGYKDGVGDEFVTDEAYFLDLDTFEWTQVESMPSPHAGVGCGIITGPGGEQELVVQEGTEVEIFNLSSLEWRAGPDYPEDVFLTSPGQLEDTFVLFGGNFGDGTYTESIYSFDTEEYQWERFGADLSVERYNLKAVEIPDRLLDC